MSTSRYERHREHQFASVRRTERCPSSSCGPVIRDFRLSEAARSSDAQLPVVGACLRCLTVKRQASAHKSCLGVVQGSSSLGRSSLLNYSVTAALRGWAAALVDSVELRTILVSSWYPASYSTLANDRITNLACLILRVRVLFATVKAGKNRCDTGTSPV